MKLSRAAAAIASTAIVLTAAGVVTGVGVSSASAYMVSGGQDEAVMHLDKSDVQRIDASHLEAENDCATFRYFYASSWAAVPEMERCTETLYYCAGLANQAWTTVSVRFESDGNNTCIF